MFATFGDAFDEFGVRLMSLGVGLAQELGDEFRGDFDEFDEFGGRVCCVFVAFIWRYI